MRYRFALLLLIAALPLIPLRAAPILPPYAILDIGPPPKGMSSQEHIQERIFRLTDQGCYLWYVAAVGEGNKMAALTSTKQPRRWLAENIRVRALKDGSHLHLTFQAGTRAEQIFILNALLRYYTRKEGGGDSLKFLEESLIRRLKLMKEAEKRLKEEKDYNRITRLQRDLKQAKVLIDNDRYEISRRKKVNVIKWAK